MTKLPHMGVFLTAQRVKPNPQKPDGIQAIPAPTNTDKIRGVLGVPASEDSAAQCDPLKTLLKRDTAFIWEAAEQKALYEIKALTLISNAHPSKTLKPMLMPRHIEWLRNMLHVRQETPQVYIKSPL